jgi:hypothetical protein
VIGLPVAVARADESEESNPSAGKVAVLNRKAMEEYQNLNFEEARRLLEEALDLAARSGLSQHPIRARTFLNLGIVTMVGLRDRDAAVRHFRRALEIDPDIKLSRAFASPDIRGAFDEALQGLASAPPQLPRPTGEMLLHDPVLTSLQNQPITVAVFPQQGLAPSSLVLAYRPAGAVGFSEVKMQRKPSGAFDGTIPANATTGPLVSYYIIATRADGQPLASRGSAESPLVVALSEAPTSPIAIETGPGPAVTHPSDAGFELGLMIGSGAGWTAGPAEQTRDMSSHGFAWARLGHITPEIGYWVTPQLLLAVTGRLQLVTGPNDYHLPAGSPDCGGDGICSPAQGAFAGFLKGAWFFSGQGFRPYVSLEAGAGQIRHVTTISSKTTCGSGTMTCVDTVASGPFLFGPGAGFHLSLAKQVDLVLAIEAILGAPTLQVNLDGNLGIAFHL